MWDLVKHIASYLQTISYYMFSRTTRSVFYAIPLKPTYDAVHSKCLVSWIDNTLESLDYRTKRLARLNVVIEIMSLVCRKNNLMLLKHNTRSFENLVHVIEKKLEDFIDDPVTLSYHCSHIFTCFRNRLRLYEPHF